MFDEVLKANNVKLHPDMGKDIVTSVHFKLHPVMTKLVQLYPLWIFVVDQRKGEHAVGFTLNSEGEALGRIRLSFRGQTNNLIEVSNDRISNARTRKSGYQTENPDKALTMVKKMFTRSSIDERISKAQQLAGSVITNIVYQKKRELQGPTDKLEAEITLLMHSDAGAKFFMDYVLTLEPTKRDAMLSLIEKKQELKMNMVSIEEIKRQYDDCKTALVIKESGRYIVRGEDVTQIYNDEQLPHWMRVKLGLLKLVDVNYSVAGVGCKVSDEVFILLAPTEDQA
jgi:hypothetical protein